MNASKDNSGSAPLLEIHTFGGLRILRGGEPVTGLASRKVEALLVYLGCTGRSQPREVLADFLWDDFSQTRAMNNLRVVLSSLRKHLGEYLIITRESVAMNPESNVRLDVVELEAHLSAAREQQARSNELTSEAIARTEQAVQIYQEEFLQGFYVRDSRGFDEWFSVERERLHRLVLDGLAKLVMWYLAHREFMTGIQFATRWLQLDPLMEAAHRQMMLLLAYTEQQAAALKQYEACTRLLEEELGVTPSEETTAIYKAIREGTLAPPEIMSVATTLAPAPGDPPFKGLQYFDVADADYFFGREELTAKLVERLRGQQFLAIVGASGSGKSSLVRAGMISIIEGNRHPADGSLPPGGGERWSVHLITPSAHPLKSLARSLTREAETVKATTILMDDMAHDPRSLDIYVQNILSGSGADRLLLVVDQFEELFTQCWDEAERRAFINNLLAAASEETAGPTVVVITLRADFYAHCAQFEDLRKALETHQVYIGQMDPRGLRQTIEGPAAEGGWDLEPGLVDLLLRDVGAHGKRQAEPGALPLLSHALLETWQRRRGHTLTFAGYADSGGVRGAIAKTAETVFNQELTTDQRPITRNIFLRLTELGEGAQDTRRRATLAELIPGPEEAPAVHAVLKTLADARLITTGKEEVEVAHEVLIREWPRLGEWLAEDREGLRLHRQLTEAAKGWQALERDEGALYRGARLAQAEEWAESHGDELNALERDFLESSQALARREEAEREAQRQRELEAARNLAESEKRRAEEQAQAAGQLRRRALFLVGALAVVVVLAAAAFLAGRQAIQNAQIAETKQAEAEAETEARATAEAHAISERETAERQARLATSRELSLAALNNLEVDPELTILLALQALDSSYTKEAEEALRQGLQTLRVLMTLEDNAGTVWAAIYSPGGSHIATGSDDGTIKVWEAASGQLLYKMPFSGVHFMGQTLAFDEAGKEVAVVTFGDNFESVILHTWNVGSGELLSQIKLPIPLIFGEAAALSPDWQWIAAGREDGTVELWGVETAEKLLTLSGHDDKVGLGVSFSPDGSRLVTASINGQVQVWDVEASLEAVEGQLIVSFVTQNHARLLRTFFNADGSRLALGFLDGPIEVWNLADISQPEFILPVGFDNIAFHPDDTNLATADGDVKLWDLTTGEELFSISGPKGTIRLPDFSPDGSRLLAGSDDGKARIWNVKPYSGGEILTFAVAPSLFDLELSPDEQKAALGSETGPATVWDAETGERLLTLPGEPETAVYRVAYHPDGSRLATVGADGFVRIWDAETGELLLRFTGHTEGSSAGSVGTLDVEYSPDGLQLATAGADKLAKIWDAETGQELMTLAGHSAGLVSLEYSPDGRYLATSSDSIESSESESDAAVKIWDTDTGEEVYTLGPNPQRAWGLAFSPDGHLLATGGSAGFLSVWDLTTGNKLIDMTGQASTIGSVAFTPDGQRLVSGGIESASIWDLATGTELVNLAPKNNWMIALTEDGRRLYGADYYAGAVRVYAVLLEDTIALAQSRLTRSLSEEECRQYLHVPTCP